MAATQTAHERLVSLERIRVPDNVRELDDAHVAALAGSIALQGMLVPLVVRADGEGFELVAGFHRFAAARKLGLNKVPVVVRDAATEDTDRAIENIARKQLNPYEEARAVKAMLARGLTEDGTAQALGWPKSRVTTRMRLLELPERAQQMVGDGELSLTSVDVLRHVGAVSRPIQELVIEYLDHDDTAWARERLEGDPGWVIGQALQAIRTTKTWAEYLSGFGTRDLAELELGKAAEQQAQELDRLSKAISPYAYASQLVRFTAAEIDQARAAGVLIAFEHGTPIITDRRLYRELVKQALARAVEEYRDKAADAKKAKAAQRGRGGDALRDPLAEATRANRQAVRELSDQAHGVNLDLGASLISGLSRVDPNDMAVARFFVFALLGPDPRDGSAYSSAGERVRRIAAYGVRLVVEEFRKDATKTKKDGTRGRLKIDYGDSQYAHHPADVIAWLWKFLSGAKTPGDLYGRALVVIAAERYAASRIVLPASQRQHAQRYASHKDVAEKALARLAGPHIPASMKQLTKAIDSADAALREAELTARETRGESVARDDATDASGRRDDDDIDAEV